MPRVTLVIVSCLLANAAFGASTPPPGNNGQVIYNSAGLWGAFANSSGVSNFATLGTSGILGTSFTGTSLDYQVNYPGKWEISTGTSGSPFISAGATVKISRTDATPVAACQNSEDSECDPALAVYANSTTGSTVQTTGIYTVAHGISTAAANGTGAVGIYSVGYVSGLGTQEATGAFLQGIRTTSSAANVQGLQLQTVNYGNFSCSYVTNGLGTCDGEDIYGGGDGVHTQNLSAAVNIGTFDSHGLWHSGLLIENAVDSTGYSIDDESSAAFGIYLNGTHGTAAIVTSSTAGNVGFGTLSPNHLLTVIGTSGPQEYVSSSGAHDGFVQINAASGNNAYVGLLSNNTVQMNIGASSSGGFIFDATSGGGTVATFDLGAVSLGKNTNQLVLPAAGNVGIGTATPASALDVYGAINISGANAVSEPEPQSIAVGGLALNSWAPTGTGQMVAVGYEALQNATTAAQNNGAFGWRAMLSCTTCTLNDAIGHDAMNGNQIGTGNVAIGEGAMFGNFLTYSSNFNTGVGENALLVIGSSIGRNTSIGQNSMMALTLGQDNTCIGQSCLSSVTTSSSNVGLGRLSLNNLTTGAGNNLGVGYNTLAPSATSSFTMNIDNIIFGTNVGFGASGTAMVGIGTASPAYPLQVIGTSSATSYYAGSTAGVTCSGSPSSSFATVNGIVTHC